MSDLPAILPCPFCGDITGTVQPGIDDCPLFCWCESCHATGPEKPTHLEAVTAWNSVAGLKAEVERLREAMKEIAGHGEHHWTANKLERLAQEALAQPTEGVK